MESPIDLKGYFHAIRERLWLILFLTAACGGLAYYNVQKAVPIYSARCSVAVERQDRVLTRIESVKADVADNSWITTMIETMKSKTMMDRLAARMGNKAISPPVFIISNRGGSTLIDVTTEHPDPQVASDWANGLVDEYQKFRMEAVTKATATANQFLLDEANRIRDKLTTSELALQEYREKKNAVSLERDQDVVVSRFMELSGQFNEARDKRLRVEADLKNSTELNGKPEELAKLTSVASHPSVVAAQSALASTENQMAVLKQRYLPKHPKYKALQTELDIGKTRLSEALVTAARSLKDTHGEAVAQEDRLRQEMQSQEKKTYDLGKLQVNYDKLKREIDADKVVYEQVLARLKETDLSKGLEEIQNAPLKIIEPATASTVPIRPDKKRMLLGGIFGGLGLGLFLAIGLHLLDSSLRTVNEVESLLNVPVLSAVASRKKLPSQWSELPKLDTVHHSHGPISEAYRTLRSSLILLGRDKERKIVLVTSAVPGEGKSFTACNYAVTLAHQGLRTVLVDLDLRRPTIGKTFFEVPPRKGAADVLAGLVPLSEAVADSSVPGLSILAAGSRAPNPSELLGSGSLEKLLSDLTRMFDRVIIDSPPVIAVSDPLLISPYVDTILQVIRSHETPRHAAQRAFQALSKAAGRPVSGIVLNQLPEKSRNYYYYYYSGHYGEKGVYGAPA